MGVRVVCPECGKPTFVPDSLAGKTLACRTCAAKMLIPGGSPPPPLPPRIDSVARPDPEPVETGMLVDLERCPLCGVDSPVQEMVTDDDGRPICGECHRERSSLFAGSTVEFATAAAAPAPATSQAVQASSPPRAPVTTIHNVYRAPVTPQAAKRPGGATSNGAGGMLVGGAICAAGIGGTLWSYSAATSASGGGRYVIFTGAIIGGAIRFFVGLARTMKGN